MRNGYRRLGLRESLAKNKAYLDFLADGKETESHWKLRPKRVRKQKTPDEIKAAEAAKTVRPLERVILRDIIKLLRSHSKVAFAHRQQSGVFREGERVIRVGIVGLPDINGMLVGGRYLGIEVKRHGGTVSAAQQHRIDQINRNGGLGFVAYCVDDVIQKIGTP